MNHILDRLGFHTKRGSGLIGPGLIILFISLVLTGCFLPLTPPPSQRQPGGKLSITIPHYAAWLEKYLPEEVRNSKTRSAKSRAFAYVDYALVEIEDASGNSVIDPQSVDWEYPEDQSQPNLSLITDVPAGTDYTVRVSVYNYSSNTDDPVVRGEVSGVTISEGLTNNLSITCFPVAPLSIAVDSGPWTASLDHSGEKWYRMNVTNGQTYYIATDGVAAVFGADGILLDDGGYIEFEAEYTGNVYLVTLNTSDNALTVSLNVTSVPPELNEGTPENPVVLTVGAPHTFMMGPSDSGYENSYYAFTTGAAGAYALDTELGEGCEVNVYDDQTYSEPLNPAPLPGYGFVSPELSAGITLYFVLTNTSSSVKSASGVVIDEAGMNEDFHCDGSPSSPMVLELDTPVTARVGNHSYDRYSYYVFTTGAGIEYKLLISGKTPGDCEMIFEIFADPSFTDHVETLYSYGSGGTEEFSCMPDMTYYIMAYSDAFFEDEPVSFTAEIEALPAPSFVPLTAPSAWTTGNISDSDEAVWYAVSVTPGETYAVFWDDSWDGSGDYSADVYVYVYRANRMDTYFANDDGYSFDPDHLIVVPDDESVVYIKVNGFYTGSFALKVDNPPAAGGLDITFE